MAALAGLGPAVHRPAGPAGRDRRPARAPHPLAPRYADALGAQRGIWIDAGVRDEWFLDLGATAFRETLRDLGISDSVINFELFDGTHMGIDYRYPLSLAWLCHRLAE